MTEHGLAAAPAASSAGADRSPGTLKIGGREYVVEFPSARKSSSALRLLKAVSGTVKDVTKALGAFRREYARDHVIELDRVQARVRYPPTPLLDPRTGGPVREPDEVDGKPNPRAGELVLAPSPIDGITPEDWEKSGHVLRRPMAPSWQEEAGAVFDLALEQAEDEVYKLLALFTLSNAEVALARREQRLDEVLAERADVLLDEGLLDEVYELAVVIGETIDERFRAKAAELGDRSGKALRLLGIDLSRMRAEETPTEAPTTDESHQGEEAPQTTGAAPQTGEEDSTPSASSTPTSSTGSPASTDGPPTSPSTPTTDSSSTSAPASTASAV